MGATSRAVSSWKAVIAAMLYLTTFLALISAAYAAVVEHSFIDAFIAAYPRYLAMVIAGYACAAMFELCVPAVRTATKIAPAENAALSSHPPRA